MKTQYRDKFGQLLGWSVEDDSKIRIYNNHGQLLGWFDKTSNNTYSRFGQKIGSGNQITQLLNC